MRHTDFLSKAHEVSNLACALAKDGDIDGVNSALDNRERLIGLIDRIQQKAEIIINELDPNTESKEIIEIIKTWANDINIFSVQMAEKDHQLKEILIEVKENTKKEISATHSQKEKFKGYNLNSVK
jgi:hypothetical protein